jgi:hypothetical protein
MKSFVSRSTCVRRIPDGNSACSPGTGIRHPNRTRAILNLMIRRVAALLIALVVAAAPIALEACQITCASSSTPSRGMQPSDAHPMHHDGDPPRRSCHETGKSAHTLSPGSPPCEHNDAVISWSVVTTRPEMVTSAPVHVVTFDLADTARAFFADRGHVVVAVNRLELRFSSPLRI